MKGTKCRICLTQSKNMYDLCSNVFEDESEMCILDILESVVSAKVLCSTTFPSKICAVCMSLLKMSYNFLIQFYKSQEQLEQLYGESSIYKPNNVHKPSPPKNTVCTDNNLTEVALEASASVEVLIGKEKYNLNEIIVVEGESDSDCDFRGFLNNLGSEVTASFVYAEKKNPNLDGPSSQIRKQQNNSKNEISIMEVSKVLQSDQETGKGDDNQENHQVKRKLLRRKRSKIKDKPKRGKKEKSDFFPCLICKKIFNTKKKLTTHNRQCHNDKKEKFTCEICGHVTQTKSGFSNHRLNHFEKKNACQLCGKKFKTGYVLQIHMRGHKNLRQHLCNICGKGFNYANALKYHLRLHTDEKNYVCNYCGKKFNMSCALKRHIRVHTGEKPYKCSYCDKSYPSKGQLDCHEYGHTGLRPYHCKYCQKGFTKSHNMKVHLLSHDGPHKCVICGKSFIEFDILSMHYKIVHKNEFIENSQKDNEELLNMFVT